MNYYAICSKISDIIHNHNEDIGICKATINKGNLIITCSGNHVKPFEYKFYPNSYKLCTANFYFDITLTIEESLELLYLIEYYNF